MSARPLGTSWVRPKAHKSRSEPSITSIRSKDLSAGHGHSGGDTDTVTLSTQTLDRLLLIPEIIERLDAPHEINREFDLPYLGGYDKAGHKIYIDRHFPSKIEGRNLIPHIVDHERFEKAVMDILGWGYTHAHEAANAFERRGVLKAGMFWNTYNKWLDPFIKADEHEKLVKVPPTLDMKPYYEPPIDHKLIAHMEIAMGLGKQSKEDVGYKDGTKKEHCGICEEFEVDHKNGCHLVRGYINAEKWCRLFSKEGAKSRK